MITYLIDEKDTIGGFVCTWIRKLAGKCEHLYVIAQEVRHEITMPNVTILSLKKEKAFSKFHQFLRFQYFVIKYVVFGRIEGVFTHLMQIYPILAGPWCKLRKTPLVMWYTHKHNDILLKTAYLFCNKIVTATSESFPIKGRKIIPTGHGINCDKYIFRNWGNFNPQRINIVSVGRIGLAKKYETVLQAANLLKNKYNINNFHWQIVGGESRKDESEYVRYINDLYEQLKLQDCVTFAGPVPNTEVAKCYQDADIFVNTTPKGSFDKSVLESMSSGNVAVACAQGFDKLFGKYSNLLYFKENNSEDLAYKLNKLLGMQKTEMIDIATYLSKAIRQNHNVDILMDKLIEIFKEENR